MAKTASGGRFKLDLFLIPSSGELSFLLGLGFPLKFVCGVIFVRANCLTKFPCDYVRHEFTDAT